jgi:uncharacterized protein YodC (DUF2158 family)
MMRAGQMVRHQGGGPAMRVLDVFHDMVRCVIVDGHGCIRQRFHYQRDLTPLWLSLQPRTLWPDPGQLDMLGIEKEEREAAAQRKAKAAISKKPKRSNKIKGRSDAA